MASKWMVSELYSPDDPGLPRYVIAHRQHESPWACVWEHRDKVQSKLATWFRELSAANLEPLARPLLGRRCALNEATAHAICRFRVQEIARMAGCPEGEIPSFLYHDEKHVGGKGDKHPCAVVKGGRVQRFPSIADAARYLGVRRPAVSRAVGRGLRCGGGAVAM